eukprot:gene40191-53112_t
MKANSNKYTKRKRSQSRTSYEKSKAAKTDQVDRLDSEKSTSRSSDSGSHDDTVGHFAGLKGDLIRNRCHYAIVFERLGISLYDFIKMNDYRGLPLYCVRDVA